MRTTSVSRGYFPPFYVELVYLSWAGRGREFLTPTLAFPSRKPCNRHAHLISPSVSSATHSRRHGTVTKAGSPPSRCRGPWGAGSTGPHCIFQTSLRGSSSGAGMKGSCTAASPGVPPRPSPPDLELCPLVSHNATKSSQRLQDTSHPCPKRQLCPYSLLLHQLSWCPSWGRGLDGAPGPS